MHHIRSEIPATADKRYPFLASLSGRVVFKNGRVDRGLPWLQAEVCFLRLPPGFPAVPLYLSHTFGCSPAPHRTGQADFPYIRLLG